MRGGATSPGGGARPPRLPLRLRLGLSRWPTGLACIAGGVLVMVAATYLGGRGAPLAAIGLAGALAGVGADLAVAAAQGAAATGRRGAIAGAIGAAMSLVLHMQITNSGACAVAWMSLLVYGLPLMMIAGGIGGAILVFWLARGNVPGPRGGDRAAWPVLVVALAVALYATLPVTANAVSYSRWLTAARLHIESVTETAPVGGWVALEPRAGYAGGLALRIDYSEYPPRQIEVFGPEGRLGAITHELPDGSGNPRLVSDARASTAYVVWSQPTAASTWEQPEYQIYLRRLDPWAVTSEAPAAAEDGERRWVFPVASPNDGWPGELRMIHGEYALVASGHALICYRLDRPDQVDRPVHGAPTETWRHEASDSLTWTMVAAGGGTVAAADYGTETIVLDLTSGAVLWRGLEASCAPAYDQVNDTWVIAGQEMVQARGARDGSLRWSGPLGDADPAAAGSGLRSGARFPSLLMAGERLLVLNRPLETPLRPYMGAVLSARDPASGMVIWQQRLESAAHGILCLTRGGTVLITGSHRQLLGFDADEGDRLFRGFPGVIGQVLELGQGSDAGGSATANGGERMMLFDELGRIVYATIQRHR